MRSPALDLVHHCVTHESIFFVHDPQQRPVLVKVSANIHSGSRTRPSLLDVLMFCENSLSSPPTAKQGKRTSPCRICHSRGPSLEAGALCSPLTRNKARHGLSCAERSRGAWFFSPFMPRDVPPGGRQAGNVHLVRAPSQPRVSALKPLPPRLWEGATSESRLMGRFCPAGDHNRGGMVTEPHSPGGKCPYDSLRWRWTIARLRR